MKYYEDLNDYELVSMALEQNEDAINLLYKKYQPVFKQKSHKFLKYFRNKGVDYEDLIQECIIAFEEALNKFNPNEDITFYTFVNICIDRQLLTQLTKLNRDKNKALNEAIPLEVSTETDNNLIDIIADSTSNPELGLLSTEELANLSSKIIAQLTGFEECVFKLKIQNFTVTEIADILDKDEKSIYNTIQRIKIKIKPFIKNT